MLDMKTVARVSEDVRTAKCHLYICTQAHRSQWHQVHRLASLAPTTGGKAVDQADILNVIHLHDSRYNKESMPYLWNSV